MRVARAAKWRDSSHVRRRDVSLLVVVVACARGGVAAHGDSGGGQVDSSGTPDVFVAGPDADTCPMLPCSLSPQCGCPGANMACDINAMTQMGTACRMVTSPGMESATCSTGTDCAAGFVCVGDSFFAECDRYCAHDTDCASPRGRCVIQLNNSSSQPITGAIVCSSNCDPTQAANALCPTGAACDLFSSTFMGTTYDIVDCRKSGTATQGQTCSTTVACAAGLTCVNNGTTMTCSKICPRPQNTGCPAGKTCTSFSTAFTVGGQEYGACI